MLLWHSHQGNYGPALRTSDPENLSGLHQQLTCHSRLSLAHPKSAVMLLRFVFALRPALREQLLPKPWGGKGKTAAGMKLPHRVAWRIHDLHFIG